MRRRVRLEGDARLVVGGVQLGRVTSLSLELDEDALVALLGAEEKGGLGGDEVSSQQTSLTREESEKKNGGGAGGGSSAEPIDRVWAHYVATMAPRKKELAAEERAIIRDALKVASEDECCRAIDGCASSEFHMGRSRGSRRKFNALSQILRSKRASPHSRGFTTRERIDFFLDLAERAGVPSRRNDSASVDPAKLQRAKQEVRDAKTFPGDAEVVKRGKVAAAWLAQHDIETFVDDDDRVRFRELEQENAE